MLTQGHAEKVIQKASDAAGLYHRLVLLVGLPGTGKTNTLQNVSSALQVPLLNVNLLLSRGMLELTERQRALRLPKLLASIADVSASSHLLLDNIEILFDIRLKQDPLRLLQGLSRNRTVVAAWSGLVDQGHIVYAAPGHAEYKRYPIRDFLLVTTEDCFV